MGNKPATAIAIIIFLIVAMAHAYRLVRHIPMNFGSHAIPEWVSWAGIVIPLLLVWGLWREAHR